MTWPITNPEYGTYPWLATSLAVHLKYDASPARWNHEQQGILDWLIQRGLFQFYYPTPLGEGRPSHRWSFLFPSTTLSLSAGTATYDLPSDFAGQLNEFVYGSTNQTWRITIVAPEALRQALNKGTLESLDPAVLDPATTRAAHAAADTPSGLPVAAAIEPKAHTGATRQVYQVTFYPSPHKALTLTYRYQVQPSPLSIENPWPLGTTVHAETILASCLAVAHERFGGTPNAKAMFQERLAASIAHDKQVGAPTGDLFPVLHTGRSDLAVDYFYLQRQVGQALELGWNPDSWTYEHRRRVDEVIESGLRKYYYPDPVDGVGVAHTWTFLNPIGTLVTAANQRFYALPDNFERFLGPLTFTDVDNLYPPIDVTSEARLRALFFESEATSVPCYAATRVMASEGRGPQRQELILHPTPDATYTLSFKYHALQQRLSETNPLPLGGALHGEGILASCLAAAELAQGIKNGPHYQAYQRRIVANIMADSKRAPQILGYNGNGQDTPWHSRDEFRRQYMGKVLYNGQEWNG